MTTKALIEKLDKKFRVGMEGDSIDDAIRETFGVLKEIFVADNDGSVTVEAFMFARVFGSIFDMNLKNRNRNRRLDALEARLAELEAKPIGKSMRYHGVWDGTQQYAELSLVTFKSSLWIAKRDTTQRPDEYGNGERAWQLCAKGFSK